MGNIITQIFFNKNLYILILIWYYLKLDLIKNYYKGIFQHYVEFKCNGLALNNL